MSARLRVIDCSLDNLCRAGDIGVFVEYYQSCPYIYTIRLENTGALVSLHRDDLEVVPEQALEVGDRVKALPPRSSNPEDSLYGILPGATGTVRHISMEGTMSSIDWDDVQGQGLGSLYYNYKLEKIPTLTLESLEKRVAQLETPVVDLAQETQDRTTVQNLTRYLTLAEIKLIRKYL